MLKSLARNFLSTRNHYPGQTVQVGWFIFRIVDNASPPELESLDFKQTASFTPDFTEADRIYRLQQTVLASNGLKDEAECTLQHSALVSRAYLPGCDNAFIKRAAPTSHSDSGWYIGIFDDTSDMNDVKSFERRSLYELTIADMRMAPFWLLPTGSIVALKTGEIQR